MGAAPFGTQAGSSNKTISNTKTINFECTFFTLVSKQSKTVPTTIHSKGSSSDVIAFCGWCTLFSSDPYAIAFAIWSSTAGCPNLYVDLHRDFNALVHFNLSCGRKLSWISHDKIQCFLQAYDTIYISPNCACRCSGFDEKKSYLLLLADFSPVMSIWIEFLIWNPVSQGWYGGASSILYYNSHHVLFYTIRRRFL